MHAKVEIKFTHGNFYPTKNVQNVIISPQNMEYRQKNTRFFTEYPMFSSPFAFGISVCRGFFAFRLG